VRGHRDLTLASAAAVLCALVAALVPWELIRLIAALPLTLFLPGYAIVAAAFYQRELAPPKRLTLSVAASLMVLALGTLVLNAFPFGLRTASWAVFLPLVVIGTCAWAALRRGRPSRQPRPLLASLGRPTARTAVLVGAAILVGAAAVALAQKPLPAKNADGFTVLWMLPADSREEAVVVGVESNEQDPASYRLEVSVGAGESRTEEIELDPGEGETFEVEVPSPTGSRRRVVASLYREDRPGHLFRRVTRWLPRQSIFP
jgi:hypothetical protein